MVIGIDYTAGLKQSGGIGRYTKGLVTTLARLDTTHQYRLLTTKDASLADLQLFNNYANFSHCRYPLAERWMTIGWHRFYLPIPVEWFAGEVDLFHSPNFILPPTRHAKTLLTVHDLSFMRHPQGAWPSLRNWLNKVVPRSLARADHVLADSEHTKRDLIELFSLSADNITVVGAGVEPRFQLLTDITQRDAVRARYRLPEKFILGLGTLEPRKNFVGLIQAFEDSPVRETHHLVIGGGKGWLYEEIFATAAASPMAERIHLIGFVADEDLPLLYNLADVFAYPSHYEGFGIPVIEAMACGTPVVCADNSCLPEVAGQAAMLVKATDKAALAAALYTLVTDMTARQQAIERGLQQARQFTWEAAAQRLLQVYERFSLALKNR
jgi:glycosyltransferase involved in cell wall biosynthesis